MAIGTPTIGTLTERIAEASSSIPYPSSVGAGDCLVLWGSSNSASATSTILPSGWTQVAQLTSTGNTIAPNLFVAIKPNAAGTEGGTSLTLAHANIVSIWQILSFPGVSTVTPQDVTASTVDSSVASVSIIVPGVTVGTTGSALFCAIAIAGTGAVVTPPTGFTEVGDRGTGTRSAEASYLLGQAAGATGSITATSSSNKALGVLLVLRPLGGSAAGSTAWVGASSGSTVTSGAGAGTTAWVGAATGSIVRSGSASGTTAWVGAANGTVVTSGGGAGSTAWVGTASGTAPTGGSASGSTAWVGAASGTVVTSGAGSGTTSWVGAANGTAPAGAPGQGVGAGATAWVGLASGVTITSGSASGATAWIGAATGSAPIIISYFTFSPPTVSQGLFTRTMPWARVIIQRGQTVLKTGAFYKTVPFPSDEEVKAADVVYLGGHIYPISIAEAASLTAAGYTVTS